MLSVPARYEWLFCNHGQNGNSAYSWNGMNFRLWQNKNATITRKQRQNKNNMCSYSGNCLISNSQNHPPAKFNISPETISISIHIPTILYTN